MKEYEILVVDDDPRIVRILSETLEYEGYRVTSLSRGEAAIHALHEKRFDLVITDFRMAETDGIAVLKEAKNVNPATMVILCTGSSIDPDGLGADDYIPKPFGLEQMRKTVASCLGGPKQRYKRVLARHPGLVSPASVETG